MSFHKTLFAAVVAVATAMTANAAFAADQKTILIVDMGNIMRSVIAEELIARKIGADGLSEEFAVESRGIQGTPASPVVPSHASLASYNEANGSNAWEGSLPALEKLDLVDAFKKHKATVVSENDLKKASIVIVTDDTIRNDPAYGLNVQFPGYDDKMLVITELTGSSEGIADAYQEGSGGNKYEQTVYSVANTIDKGYANLMERLR